MITRRSNHIQCLTRRYLNSICALSSVSSLLVSFFSKKEKCIQVQKMVSRTGKLFSLIGVLRSIPKSLIDFHQRFALNNKEQHVPRTRSVRRFSNTIFAVNTEFKTQAFFSAIQLQKHCALQPCLQLPHVLHHHHLTKNSSLLSYAFSQHFALV